MGVAVSVPREEWDTLQAELSSARSELAEWRRGGPAAAGRDEVAAADVVDWRRALGLCNQGAAMLVAMLARPEHAFGTAALVDFARAYAKGALRSDDVDHGAVCRSRVCVVRKGLREVLGIEDAVETVQGFGYLITRASAPEINGWLAAWRARQ